MRPCSRRDCFAAAVREIHWRQPEDASHHVGKLLAANLCERHGAELEAKLCERDGCVRYAELVVGLDGQNIDTGAPQKDELRMWEPCWEEMKAAPSFTLNGVRMVHDGAGRMKALPPSIGPG